MRIGSGESSTNFIVCTVHVILWVIKSRRLKWAGHVARMEEGRTEFKMLTGKSKKKDIIRIDLKQIGVNTRNKCDAVQNMDYWRVLVNAALKLRVP